MSMYLYTLRSQTVTATDKTGISTGTMEIPVFSFVNGHAGEGSKHEKACLAASTAAWEKHSKDKKVPFVALANIEDVKKIRSGLVMYAPVYHGCTSPEWWDTTKFPAAGVYGLLVKDGGRLAIVSRKVNADSEKNTRILLTSNGVSGWVPKIGRTVEVVEGRIVETMLQIVMPNGDKFWLNPKDAEALDIVVTAWKGEWDKEKQVEIKAQQEQQKANYLAALERDRAKLESEENELKVKLAKIEADKSALAASIRSLTEKAA